MKKILQYFGVFLSVLILVIIVVGKNQVAPGDFFSYLKGTILLPFLAFWAFFLIMHKTRLTAFKSLVSTAITISTMAIVQQLLLAIYVWLPVNETYIHALESILFGTLLFFAYFLVNYFSGSVNYVQRLVMLVLHSGFTVTLMAWLLKLDSHPLSSPYSHPYSLFVPLMISGIICFFSLPLYNKSSLP